MRRKLSPLVLARRQGDPRSLTPARAGSLLPTAAAIAIAVASIGCSAPTLDVIAADPATKPASAPAPSPAPSPTPYLEPDPHDIDGDVAYVKPAPVASTKKVVSKPHP